MFFLFFWKTLATFGALMWAGNLASSSLSKPLEVQVFTFIGIKIS